MVGSENKEMRIAEVSRAAATSRFMATEGLASYCKAETTFPFHFSILILSNAFLSIDNKKMESESGFSLAIMASQPLCICWSPWKTNDSLYWNGFRWIVIWIRQWINQHLSIQMRLIFEYQQNAIRYWGGTATKTACTAYTAYTVSYAYCCITRWLQRYRT